MSVSFLLNDGVRIVHNNCHILAHRRKGRNVKYENVQTKHTQMIFIIIIIIITMIMIIIIIIIVIIIIITILSWEIDRDALWHVGVSTSSVGLIMSRFSIITSLLVNWKMNLKIINLCNTRLRVCHVFYE